MKKSFLHRAIAFLLSIVVLLGLVGCGSSAEMHCNACGAENDNTAKFCVECGTRLSVSTICQSCGQENDIDSKFCSSCGNTLSSQSTNQSTQNSETSDKTEETNGNQPNVDSGTTEGDSTNEPDPAENVWLLVKESKKRLGIYIDINYSYDYHGNLTTEVHSTRSSGDTTQLCHIINTLDEHNRLIKREWDDYVEEYTYDDHSALSEKILYYDHSDLGKMIYEYDIYEEGVLKRRYSSKNRSDICDSQGHATQESYYYFVTDYIYDDGKISSVLIYRDTVQYRSDISAHELKNAQLSGETFLFEEYAYYSNGHHKSRVGACIHYHFQPGIPGTILCDDTYLDTYLDIHISSGMCEIHGDADCTVWSGIHHLEYGPSVLDRSGFLSMDEKYTTDQHGNIIQAIYGETHKRTFEYMTLAEYRNQGLHESGASTGSNNNTSSSGNSNGSNNGSGDNDKGVACQHCQSGWIKCNACDGTGKVFYKYDINGNKVMRICNYFSPSTNSYCTGGKIRCYFCGGDGIFGD